MRRLTATFSLEDLQVVPGSEKRLAIRMKRWMSAHPLELGEMVRHVAGGAPMMVVDVIPTFDSPGVERDQFGAWRPLPCVASYLVTVARRDTAGQVFEEDLYLECLERVEPAF